MAAYVLPPGYRFIPTDEELIKYYLENKIKNEGLLFSHIHDVPFYNHTPQHLAKKYMGRDDVCFFFTKLSKKGSRSCRVARGGTWSGKTAGKAIPSSSKEEIIGYKRYFVYEVAGEKEKKKKPVWAMQEYTLSPPKSNEWALCKVYKTNRAATTTEEEEDDDDDAPANQKYGDRLTDSMSAICQTLPSTVDPHDINWESLPPIKHSNYQTPMDHEPVPTRETSNKRPRQTPNDDVPRSIEAENENNSKRARTVDDISLDDIDSIDISQFLNEPMIETETLLPMYQEWLGIGQYPCDNFT